MKKQFRLSLVLFFLVQCISLIGQVNDPRFSGRPTDIKEPSDSVIVKPELVYKYVLSGDLSTERFFGDTSLDNQYMFVDPSRRKKDEYIHLGYLGSSAYPLVFKPYIEKGFNLGFHQYDIYNQHIDSIRFYKTNRTLADLSFYQISGNQSNLNANADYSQNFKDGITLNVNYHRFNFDHVYDNSLNQSTSFSLGLVLDNKDLAFQSYLLFVSNINNETNNGGIADYNSFSSPNSVFRSTVGVSLSNAQNRHSSKAIKWHIDRKIFSRNINASYNLSYSWQEFFYYDNDVSDETSQDVYKSYIVDDRGIRFNLQNKKLSNEFYLDANFFKSLNLNIGLVHDLYLINEGVNKRTRNDLTVLYKGQLAFLKSSKLDLNGHLGLGSNVGNFLINLGTKIKVKDWLNLNANWSSYLKDPAYIAENLILNGQYVYQNNLNKILGTELKGGLSIPKIGISLSAQQNIVNNVIYWDENALPVQYDGVFSNTLFKIGTSHKLWKFGMEHQGVYQLNANNLFHLPKWFTTHNVFFESLLFRKNLQLRIGTNARLIQASSVVSFQPISGQFYQDGYNSLMYPEWGFYITGKVSKFRIVFEYDNLTYWFTDRVNFNVADYPNLDGNLRFGIRWLLLD